MEHAEATGTLQPIGAAGTIARNAAFRTAGEVVAKTTSLLFYVVMARKLGEDGFGDFMFALSLCTVVFLGAGFGTDELLTREVARDRDGVHAWFSDVLATKVIGCFILASIPVAVANLGGYPFDARIAVYLVGAGVALELIGKTCGSIFQAFEQMQFISLVVIVQRSVTAAIGVAVLLAGGGLIPVAGVFFFGALVALVAYLWVLRRRIVAIRFSFHRSRWRPILLAAFPIGMVTVLIESIVRLDQLLLSFLSDGGNRDVGFYAAGFRLIEATMFISWSVAGAMLPWMSRTDSDSDRAVRGFSLGTKTLACMLLPIALVYSIKASDLVEVLYGPRFDSAIDPLRLLGILVIFHGLTLFVSFMLIGRGTTRRHVFLLLSVVVLNVAVNAFTIPAFGATGAAGTALGSSIALSVGGTLIMRREIGRFSLLRAYAGPLCAGAVMAAAMTVPALPLVPSVLSGLVLYAGTLLAFERGVWPEDLDLIASGAARVLHREQGGRGQRPLR